MTPYPEKDNTGNPQVNTNTTPVWSSQPEVSITKTLPNNHIFDSFTFPESTPNPSLSDSRLPWPISVPQDSSLRSSSTCGARSLDRPSSSASAPPTPLDTHHGESRHIIVRSFAPRIAVYASPDTEIFIRHKGFNTGLCGLLRPFGERIQGTVVIRDSVGASRSWDDFGVRIFDPSALSSSNSSLSTHLRENDLANSLSYASHSQGSANLLQTVEDVLKQSLQTQDSVLTDSIADSLPRDSQQQRGERAPSALFNGYLCKLLSSTPIVPHETFAHPVACLIAVSSRNVAPIETLRQLYAQTGRENHSIPPWVGVEYLRYYVLIHDEENDDIAKSTALFDLMKRHFGLHCHLLRLKGSHCVPTDDESIAVPRCQWISVEEEMADFHKQDMENAQHYLVESDATAINALIREMVTQSIVPFMESRVMTWNDQVASRRRGFSGRFMSLSKRWTVFGSSKGSNATSNSVGNSSGSNYDAQHAFYPPEAPEAVMRHLADYAIMLRDWKLAYSTYDFVRADFGHDKAWAYHAAANEMAAVSVLLLSSPQSKSRLDVIDQLLETAVYSYLTRVSSPFEATRCLVIGMELFQNHGPLAADRAAKWAGRLLEYSITGPISQTLTTERIAEYYMSQVASSLVVQSPRRRHAALWSILSIQSWDRLGWSLQARNRIQAATSLYGLSSSATAQLPFPAMRSFWETITNGLGDRSKAELDTLIDTDFVESIAQGSSVLVNNEAFNTYDSHTIKTPGDNGGFVSSILDARNATETDVRRLIARNASIG